MARLRLQRLPNFFSRWLSDETLTKKASLSALASAIDYATRLAVGFVVNPILVAGLGAHLYGIWQILLDTFSYITAAGGRPSFALKWSLANQQASADYENKRRIVGSSIIVWLLFLPVMLVVGGLLSWFIPSLLKIPPKLTQTIRITSMLLVGNLIILSMAQLPLSVLRGENLAYKRMGLSAVLVVIGGGLFVLATYLDLGIIGLATANLSITVLTGILFLQVVRTCVPWFGVHRPSRSEVRGFLGLSGWFLIWDLIFQLIIASDVIVLGILVSPELVTTYTFTKYVPETLISFVAIVVFGITPGLGGIIGSGEFKKAIRVRGEIMMITWLIATITGSMTLLWNRAFIQLWVGGDFYGGGIPTLLVMLMVTQFVLIRNDANIIDLTLNLKNKVILGALTVVLSFVFSGVLVGVYNLGIVGLCIGFLIGRTVLSIGYPWLIGRYLGISFDVQLKSLPRSAFITILLFGVSYVLGDALSTETWIDFGVSVGSSLIVVSLLVFFIGLSREQRTPLLQRIKTVMSPSRR